MLDDLLEELETWFRSVLMDFINANLLGLFTDVNAKTATIATEVGKTPQAWNQGIFSMVQSLSQNVIVPIAGLIISFVLCYELISMVTERNNMHDIDTWIFFKWIFKSFIAVFLVSNTFNITMAVFDIGQRLVNEAGNLIGNDTEIDALGVIHDLGSQMQDMDICELMH